jgi:hypothetical protein
MHLLAQPAFRADAVAIADDQHPDQQFRVDRWSSGCAVEWCQVGPNRAEIDEAVNRAEHVVDGHLLFK